MDSLKKVPTADALKLPTSTFVIGSMREDGKPTWEHCAWCTPAGQNPTAFLVLSNPKHFSNDQIKRNKEFSVNMFPVELRPEADYVGIKSGHDVDKSEVFEHFTGELKNAPLMKKARLTFSCRLADVMTAKETNVEYFVGVVEEAFAQEDSLNAKEKVDILKLNPVLFSMDGAGYYTLGKMEHKAFCTPKLPQKE